MIKSYSAFAVAKRNYYKGTRDGKKKFCGLDFLCVIFLPAFRMHISGKTEKLYGEHAKLMQPGDRTVLWNGV